MMLNKKVILAIATALLALATGCNKVPDLTGMTKDQAQDALTKKKLQLGTIATTDKGKTPGTVVDQDPQPGAKIPANKTVALVLQSGGNAAGGNTTGGTGGTNGGTQGTANSGTVPVPDLTGKALSEAEVTLVQSGLGLRGDPIVVVNDQPPGKIFKQDPPAGTPVLPGTGVGVSIASDAIVPVPPVTGQPQEVAQQLISAAQLVPTITTDIHPGPDPVGSVFLQSPAAGEKVAKGQPVTLTVKEESVTVPRVIGDTQETAQLKLYNSGLTPAIQLVFGDASNINHVIAQSIPENTPKPRGATVTITVGGLRIIHPVVLYNKAMVLQRSTAFQRLTH